MSTRQGRPAQPPHHLRRQALSPAPREIGVCRSAAEVAAAEPKLVADFKEWLRKHHGASDATVRLYARDAAAHANGAWRARGWRPTDIRSYFLERASKCGRGTIEKMTTSLRAFLRYLQSKAAARRSRRCRSRLRPLAACRMPRYLSAEQVNRLIVACDGDASGADEIVRSCCCWRASGCGPATWRNFALPISSGKRARYGSRASRATRCACRCRKTSGMRSPATRPPVACRSDRVFLRTIAPCRPFRNGDGISSVVKRLMKRAGIVTPVKGAHVLRHTAATEMLRHGVPLEKIGLVLRHRGIDTTPHYGRPMSRCSSRSRSLGRRRSDAERHRDLSLVLRRATGFAMSTADCLLKSFAAFATERGQTYVQTQTAIDGAAYGRLSRNAMPGSKPSAASCVMSRLKTPGMSCRPAITSALENGARPWPPYIFSAAEIDRLMGAALQLRPQRRLAPKDLCDIDRAALNHRDENSEALKLTVADVTPDGLLIRETKFRKTRLVPLHDTTAEA